jgi:glycosyltransferase involved in cell wall biosynthesis
VVTEAMASGLPIVAFEHAAAAQLLTHDRHGVLVPAGDAGAFVDAAVGLAFDPVRRARLAGAARRRSLELGWDSIVRRFESTLLDVARPGSPRAPASQPLDAPKAA